MVQLEDGVGLAADEKAVLERSLSQLATLHDLIHWGLARGDRPRASFATGHRCSDTRRLVTATPAKSV